MPKVSSRLSLDLQKDRRAYEEEFRKRNELFELDNYDPEAAAIKRKPTSLRKPTSTVLSSSSASQVTSRQRKDGSHESSAIPSERKRTRKIEPFFSDDEENRPAARDYDWKGLRFKKKKSKDFPPSSADAPSYSPIAAKQAVSTSTTLYPTSHPPPRPIDKPRSFWEIPPRHHNSKPQTSYSRKPFFQARPQRKQCSYCKSRGYSGSRIDHNDEHCRMRARNDAERQKSRPPSSGDEEQDSVNSDSQQHNQAAVPSPAGYTRCQRLDQPAVPAIIFTSPTPPGVSYPSRPMPVPGQGQDAGGPAIDASSWFGEYGDVFGPDSLLGSTSDMPQTSSDDFYSTGQWFQ